VTPERWQQVKEVLATALEKTPLERAAYLDRTCTDPSLRREVESFILAHEQGDTGFLNRAAPELRRGDFLKSGARLGSYEILARIGAGGMGEVYRARDTRLNRIVAIKILPQHLAGSLESRDRFEREARTIGGLNHPHICTLHDVGHQGEIDFLVMEFIEGETLSSRLLKGPLPIEQVLAYSIQIADALDKAHRKGVTHRDLKPGNIMLTKSGAKLLDFGLAKLKQAASPAGVPLSQLPTLQDPITAQGAIVGTLQYMAPEQLEGKETDARADIFAFGAVVYEMATGKRAFEGKSNASTIAKILEVDPPPISSLQPMTPATLDRLVKTCLAKDPDNRLQSAQDAKLELEWIRDAAANPSAAEAAARVPGWRRMLPWTVAGVAMVAALALVLLSSRQPPSTPVDPVRFQIAIPASPLLRMTGLFALSPDGRQLAFVAASTDGIPRIWIRPLDSLEIQPLAGTESVHTLLFWSPDSRFIAFDAGGTLQKIDISGGSPVAICALNKTGVGGSWNSDGVILFGQFGGTLMRVSAAGGAPAPLTALDTSHGDVAHVDPWFLPDGRHFLYYRDAGTTGYISVGSLDAKPEQQDPRRLIEANSAAAYVRSSDPDSGSLLFVSRNGSTLTAQPFDPRHLTTSGDPTRVVEGPIGLFLDAGIFSVSTNGTLAYHSSGLRKTQPAWFDAQGKLLSKLGDPGLYGGLALSPDGARSLVSRSSVPDQQGSLWLLDTSRGTSTRLELDPSAEHRTGAWGADGRNIIFGSARPGKMMDIYETPVSGTADAKLLFESGDWKVPSSVSPDGRFLLYDAAGAGTKEDLWVLPLGHNQQPVPLRRTDFDEVAGRFSPDGHWVAYQSDESGRYEIYVRPFSPDALGETSSGAGDKFLVSDNGGFTPFWRKDGKELYYIDPDHKLMAVGVTTHPVFRTGVPKFLFQSPLNFDQTEEIFWSPSPDGNRFLFLVPETQVEAPFTVILNWQSALKK
jgi:serine/threonine protein kinase